jgi:hypothetical protein
VSIFDLVKRCTGREENSVCVRIQPGRSNGQGADNLMLESVMRSDWASGPIGPEIMDDPADFTAVVREFERPLGVFRLVALLAEVELP